MTQNKQPDTPTPPSLEATAPSEAAEAAQTTAAPEANEATASKATAASEAPPAASSPQTTDTQEGGQDEKFSRLQGISGWPQELLMQSKVMVCGVGALGNEVVKCLALTGIGQMLLVDFDVVEASNLTRSVLFRREDGQNGLYKVEAAARSARELNLNAQSLVQTYPGNIADLGRGIYRRMDLIFCAVDSRAARLLLNRIAREVGKVWVDGGFQYLNPWGGAISVYDGADLSGPCYACSMKPEVVMQTLDNAKGLSCGLIGQQLREQGFLSSTPTIASIVAGLQVQEGFRLLATRHGSVEEDDEIGNLAISKQISLDTRARNIQVIKKGARTGVCYEHRSTQQVGEVVEFPQWSSHKTTVGELVQGLQEHLKTERLKIVLPFPLVYRYKCFKCAKETALDPFLSAYTFTYRVRKGQIQCPQCGGEKESLFAHGDIEEINPSQKFFQSLQTRTLASVGIRPLEIAQVIYYNPQPGLLWAEITGDAPEWFPNPPPQT